MVRQFTVTSFVGPLHQSLQVNGYAAVLPARLLVLRCAFYIAAFLARMMNRLWILLAKAVARCAQADKVCTTAQELLQVPVADDVDPEAINDIFEVPLGQQSTLNVLRNDTAAYGSLAVAAVTTSTHGTTVKCVDNSCVQYTPSRRFSGFDMFGYTAEDARGRRATAEARVRISTTAPRVLGLAAHATVAAGAPVLPFSSANIAYDDNVWQLTLNVTLQLNTHAVNATRWPASTLSISGGAADQIGSVDSQAALNVRAVAPFAVSAQMSGNISTLAAGAAQLAVVPPTGYSGVGLVLLEVCSQWSECTVRACVIALYGCMPLSIGKAQLHHTFVQLSLYAAHPCMAVQL